ncbi:MAG TPA: VWA domain-containing protein [Burkholderiales bacterium]|nr:VWA domain-containing protein [Burkholderiales bacterium]
MSFISPEHLWFLLAVPALVAIYAFVVSRRKKGAVRYASLDLVKEAMGPGQRLRRHIPPLLFLLALAATLLAVARPTAVITLPSEQRTIIMAIDVSLSMRATDVEPNRLAAAQEAAKTFIQQQPADVRLGIVSFAGTALLVQSPTHNRDDLLAAIDRLELQRHTAIGSGIIVSLSTIFPDAGIDLETMIFGSGSARDTKRGIAIDQPKKAEEKEFIPVAPGSYRSAAIILLSDGRRTTGPDPLDAAKMAADRGVRVFTVGLGNAQGGMANFEGWSVYMRFDEETLRAIADVTRGEYFSASSASELKKVYETLNAKFTMEKKQTEITALVTAAAALLSLAAGTLSLLWFNRLV